jgi:hypothetical protein
MEVQPTCQQRAKSTCPQRQRQAGESFFQYQGLCYHQRPRVKCLHSRTRYSEELEQGDMWVSVKPRTGRELELERQVRVSSSTDPTTCWTENCWRFEARLLDTSSEEDDAGGEDDGDTKLEATEESTALFVEEATIGVLDRIDEDAAL